MNIAWALRPHPTQARPDKKRTAEHISDVKVSRRLREELLQRYPAMGDKKHATNAEKRQAHRYRSLTHCLLWPNFLDRKTETDEDEPYDSPDDYWDEESNRGNETADGQPGDGIVMRQETVAGCWGCHPKTPNWSAIRCLEAFSRDVFPLQIKEFSYTEGRARVVKPLLPREVWDALALESEYEQEYEEPVWFISGKPVSRRSLREEQTRYLEARRAEAEQIDPNHPAYGLMRLLHEHELPLKKLLSKNLPTVRQEALAMPTKTRSQREKRRQALAIVNFVQDHPYLFYREVDRTCRIFSRDTSIHQLPRHLRKKCLRGAIEVDLVACQLSVVARQWNVPSLLELLERDESIWAFLGDVVGKPVAQCKPVLKAVIYGIIFGQGRGRIRQRLEVGARGLTRLGAEGAERFLNHPIIKDLLAARDQQLADIRRLGGCPDAFGKWRGVAEGEEVTAKQARSFLAARVQSFELRLMMAACEQIKRDGQIYIVSFLHDGMALVFGNKTKQADQIKRIRRAIEKEAEELGIPTRAEVEEIN